MSDAARIVDTAFMLLGKIERVVSKGLRKYVLLCVEENRGVSLGDG